MKHLRFEIYPEIKFYTSKVLVDEMHVFMKGLFVNAYKTSEFETLPYHLPLKRLIETTMWKK